MNWLEDHQKPCELTRTILTIVCDSPGSLKDETGYLNNVLAKTTTTLTLLVKTLTVMPIPTLIPKLTLRTSRFKIKSHHS